MPSVWLGVRLDLDAKENTDGELDWDIVAGLLGNRYRAVVPKRALELFDVP